MKKAQTSNYSEIEHIKCKIIMERHEREKEQADRSTKRSLNFYRIILITRGLVRYVLGSPAPWMNFRAHSPDLRRRAISPLYSAFIAWPAISRSADDENYVRTEIEKSARTRERFVRVVSLIAAPFEFKLLWRGGAAGGSIARRPAR